VVVPPQSLSTNKPEEALTRDGPPRTLMGVDPGECREHALDCVRMAQTASTPDVGEIWSDLARTWLRFATDIEANECLLDEWGKPRPKQAQTETAPTSQRF